MNALFVFIISVVFSTLVSTQTWAQQANLKRDALTKNPGDLTNILIEDETVKEALITPAPLDPILAPWDQFKGDVYAELGLQLGLAYTAAYQNANVNVAPGGDDAAGGILAVLGNWRLWGEDAKYPGTFGFRLQDRHKISGPTNLQGFGVAAGSLWPTAVAYSEFDFTALEMWWEQYLIKDVLGFRVGKIIPFAVHDYSFLKNPTTGFMNAAFTLNPTIAYNSVGIGITGLFRPVPDFYIVGGIYDGNGRPDKIGFNSFFNRKEYFKAIDIGWDPGYIDKSSKAQIGPLTIRDVHATIWHKDALKKAGAPEGWGASFFAEGEVGPVLPFVRVGFSDGKKNGPAIINKMVAGGVGLREMFGQSNDLLGLAFSWGERDVGVIDTDDDNIPDTKIGNVSQYAGEIFYRVQLTKRIAVTPSLQVTVNPVLEPTKDTLTFIGIRGRFEM